VDRDYFAVEQSAPKEGYHNVPGQDRRVFTRAENKKIFGKSPSSLTTSLDLETAVSVWQNACSQIASKGKGRGKGKERGKMEKAVDVRLSDDVGTFVCGFIYYVSLLEMQKRSGRRDVVFLHVPRLEGEEQVGLGTQVVKALIEALVEGWKA
jgi:pyroglutamyl-peptidase